MLPGKGFNLVFWEESEYFDPLSGICVGSIQPELVEFIRGCFGRVEPDIAFFGLSEFAAVGFGQEGTGEGEGFAAGLAADQLGAGGDIAPLVAAAHLELAVFIRVQPIKIISLHQLVGKFGETHPIFPFEALLYAIFCRHIIYGNMFPDIPDEIEEKHIAEPVVVIDYLSGIGERGVEVEEFLELSFDTGKIVVENVLIEQVPFFALSAWVADQPGGAAHQRNWFMSSLL